MTNAEIARFFNNARPFIQGNPNLRDPQVEGGSIKALSRISWACSGHSLFIPLNLSERTPVDSPLAHKEGHRPALFGRSPLAPEALTRLHSVKYGKRPDKPFDNGPQTDIL